VDLSSAQKRTRKKEGGARRANSCFKRGEEGWVGRCAPTLLKGEKEKKETLPFSPYAKGRETSWEKEKKRKPQVAAIY